MLLQIDDETAAKLEQVAPAKSRRRSEFVREAIRRALWELEEEATAQALLRSRGVGGGPAARSPAVTQYEIRWASLPLPSGRRLGDRIGALGSGRHREVKRALGYVLDWPELEVL